jgi:hypothetical protein
MGSVLAPPGVGAGLWSKKVQPEKARVASRRLILAERPRLRGFGPKCR